MAPHRVRRLAHSLKRDIGAAAAYRHVDSPVSMTSPRTTLTRGQCCTIARSVFRGATVHLATMPPRMFLRHDLRQQADYFANQPVNLLQGTRPANQAAAARMFAYPSADRLVGDPLRARVRRA